MRRKPSTFIYSLINRHFLSCAKLHIGCWGYRDKTGQILSPKEYWSQNHILTEVLPLFSRLAGWGVGGLPRAHRPGSPNVFDLERLNLQKENKVEPQHRNYLSDPYILPTKMVLPPPSPRSPGISREPCAGIVETLLAFDVGIKTKSRLFTGLSLLPSDKIRILGQIDIYASYQSSLWFQITQPTGAITTATFSECKQYFKS